MSNLRTPVASTAIPAGRLQIIPPSYDVVDLNTFFVPQGVLVSVQGDSMIEADIVAGDFLLISPNQVPVNGDIVVVRLNNDQYTVKRWRFSPPRLFLVPANGSFRPQEVTENDLCEIEGVVRYIIKKAL